MPNLTFGNFGYQLDSNGTPLPVIAILKQYKQVDIFPSNNSIELDGTIQTGTHKIVLHTNQIYTYACWHCIYIEHINIVIENNTCGIESPFDQIQWNGFDWNRFALTFKKFI